MFEGADRQPEAMLGILLKIVEKSESGGASKPQIQEAYRTAKGRLPSDKAIQRIIRRLNQYFDSGCADDENESVQPAIEASGQKEMRRYRFTRELVAEQSFDRAQAIQMALSLYSQQHRMMAEQFEKIMKRVFSNTLQSVKADCNMEKYVYVSGYSQAKLKQNNQAFSIILRAIRTGKRVRFTYTRAYDGETVKGREVEPYGLLCRHGIWYLVGLCMEARDRRIFLLDLVDRLNIVENSSYKIPATFSLKEAYGSSWGTWTVKDSSPPERIRLQVEPGMAKKFAVTCFHDSQKMNMADDGSAEVVFQIANAGEMIPWLMTWGSTVKVLEPKWMRNKVADNARSIAEMYAAD